MNLSISRTRRALFALCGWMVAAGLGAMSPEVQAQALPRAPPSRAAMTSMDLQVGFRGVAEIWQDPILGTHYAPAHFGGTGFATFGLTPGFAVEMELGYGRAASNDEIAIAAPGFFDTMPVSMLMMARVRSPGAEVYIGAGPAFNVFTEATSVSTVTGVKAGAEFRVGTRIHTNLVEPSMRPGSHGGFRAVDVEFFIGRRQHHSFGKGTGFNLSAFRIGTGIVGRL